MKHAGVLLGIILLLTIGANAQTNAGNSMPLSSPSSDAGALPAAPVASTLLASADTPAAFPIGGFAMAGANSPASSEPDPQQPTVFGVFQQYSWQAYIGYSFFRFYIYPKPNTIENMNGLNLGIVYYPHSEWFGADGEFMGGFGSIFGQGSRFGMGAGGGRVRWAAPRGLELWAHGLVGYSRFTPQTAFGGQTAFTYEIGGGIDIGIGSNHRRIAYRVQADMVGTRFFGTYQYSPKIAAGIVFKY